MKLEDRIGLMVRLGKYLSQTNNEELEAIKKKAFQKNGWFTIEFINLALANICSQFLDEQKLKDWSAHYFLNDSIQPKKVGLVMAGNIPLVGFHDFLTVFISGHVQVIKLSEKDDVLMKHIVDKLIQWNPSCAAMIQFEDRLSGCDAYIATGSNNTSRYFEYYFGKYPSIIRKNKTSVAVLNGDESKEELTALSSDVHTYFGLGCRNVTKIYVPEKYDFVPLLRAFDVHVALAEHSKFHNNYDYNLALLIMNKQYYMSNQTMVLVENEQIFSPVSVLYYSYYQNRGELEQELLTNPDIQTIVGRGFGAFGTTQIPSLTDYADGVDVMQFLLTI